ncbi:putative hydrolase [Gluconacetobacter sacchari DSM 12717]|nr:alpha/beta fold hydrolase [Gluconacetobacter sacchari]GBQ22474.1 putative hydrolase [Gluconacetobacter sacchari DSM 12717]
MAGGGNAQDGEVLTWQECGSAAAPSLVLLHGIGSDARLWRAQLAAFAPERRVLAWNAPGYAESSPFPEGTPTGDPTLWAQRLMDGLDALGVSSCVLVGHSLGAVTAARFARLWPERVKALVLSSPAQGYGQSPGAALLPALQARIDDITSLGPRGMAEHRAPRTLGPGADAAMIRAVTDAMARVSVRGYCDAVRLLAGGRLADDLPAWNGPLHLVCAEEDRIVPPATVETLAALRPSARLCRIAGAGHASYLQAPDLFNRCLAHVLANREPD